MKPLSLICALALLVSACSKSKDEPSAPATAAQINSFYLSGLDSGQISIDQSTSTIRVSLPPAFDPTHLTPTVTVNSGSSLQPGSGVAGDFSRDVNYTVTNGSTARTYKVSPSYVDFAGKSQPKAPAALCIYYGYPSAVNGSASVAQAVTQFSKFDLIVLGNGLDDPNHSDHYNTVDIIRSLRGKKVYGYVSAAQASTRYANFIASVNRWSQMGVAGIFVDEFDQVDRTTQNLCIDGIHASSLTVFANGTPEKVLLASGTEESHLREADYFLLESFLIGHGVFTAGEFKKNGDIAYRAMRNKKIGIAVVSTLAQGSGNYNSTANAQPEFTYAWCGAAMYNFDAFQFTEANYSAQSSNVYYFPNPYPAYGSGWIETDWLSLSANGTSYTRSTDTKRISVNLNAHTGSVD